MSKLYCLTWTFIVQVLNHTTAIWLNKRHSLRISMLSITYHRTQVLLSNSLHLMIVEFYQLYLQTGDEELVSWWESLRGWSVRTLSQFAQVKWCRKSRLTMKLVRKSLQTQVGRLTRCCRSLILYCSWYFVCNQCWISQLPQENLSWRVGSETALCLAQVVVSSSRPSPQLVL